MGTWSSTEPTLPSGESWGNTQTDDDAANHFRTQLTVQSARGIGNTYYLKVSVYWTKGSYGDYSPPDTVYYVVGTEGVSIGKPSEWNTYTRYYTGTAASSASVTAGVSQYSDRIPSGWSKVTQPVAAPKYWTVSYNGNGATGGSTASQTKVRDTALTLRSNGFTRTNYTFQHWNTAADDSGTTYAAGASYTGNAALTLYAIWKKNNIPLYANDNGMIRQIEKAYVNVDGVIKECTVYANVNGVIKELV